MTSLTVLQFSRKEGLKLQLFHENINANTDNEGALDIIDAATTNKWEDSEEMDLLKNDLFSFAEGIITSNFVVPLWECLRLFSSIQITSALGGRKGTDI